MQQHPFKPSEIMHCDDIALLQQKETFESFTEYINYLIHHNFEKLVYVLYRIDVDEMKLRSMLNTGEDTAPIIAKLVIDRQIAKIKTRESFKTNTNTSDDEERWH